MPETNQDELSQLYQTLSATGLPERLFALARDEDLGTHSIDLTGTHFVDDRTTMQARIVAREAGVIAGLAAIPDLIACFGFENAITCRQHVADGAIVQRGDSITTFSGSARAIVTIERTVLNLIGRLSGVATITKRYVDAMGRETSARLYDTRKTTPGLRVLEKYAVRCGGGCSHRLGLYDAIMVKDNHIAGLTPDEFARTIDHASQAVRALKDQPGFVEVEVDSLEQFDRLLQLEPGLIDFVLLDNFTTDQLVLAVNRRDAAGSPFQLEASGGITLETIGKVARTGVDRISVGALTHAAISLDIGMDAA